MWSLINRTCDSKRVVMLSPAASSLDLFIRRPEESLSKEVPRADGRTLLTLYIQRALIRIGIGA